jgi:hypothetical protein
VTAVDEFAAELGREPGAHEVARREHPATGTFGGIVDGSDDAGIAQSQRGIESREPGTDDDDTRRRPARGCRTSRTRRRRTGGGPLGRDGSLCCDREHSRPDREGSTGGAEKLAASPRMCGTLA